jgi:hypothetical protein
MRMSRFALSLVTLLGFLLVSAPASARQADKCDGALSFGEIAVCPSITDDEQHILLEADGVDATYQLAHRAA